MTGKEQHLGGSSVPLRCELTSDLYPDTQLEADPSSHRPLNALDLAKPSSQPRPMVTVKPPLWLTNAKERPALAHVPQTWPKIVP